jgi:hypothetical protein
MTPAPYPADTRARGWRFEVDTERIRQSDTWALASPESRPWLLMLWMVAWEQTPCGSLPGDERLIAARIDMPVKAWAKHREVLMRGWELADDGRRYHRVLTERVTEMMKARRRESDRKALARARASAATPQEDGKSPTDVPRDKHGTDAGLLPGLHPESGTGTGTGTGTYVIPLSGPDGPERGITARALDPEPVDVSPATRACMALIASGVPSTECNAANPTLAALCECGATTEEFAAAGAKAKGRSNSFAYALAVVKGQREDAAKVTTLPPRRGAHGGFAAKDYRAGVNPDGSFS